jgi:outer membrane protein
MKRALAPTFVVAALMVGSSVARPAVAQDAAPASSEPQPKPPGDADEPEDLEHGGAPRALEPFGPVPADMPDMPDVPDESVDEGASLAPGGPVVDAITSPRPMQGAKRLRLEDAIELALRRHPRILAARDQTRAAEARVGQAQAQYYPRVDGWLQYLRASENGSLAAFHGVPGLSRVGGSIRVNEETGEAVRWHHSFNNYLVALIVQQMIYDFGRTQGAVGAQRAYVKAAKMNELLVQQMVAYGVMQAFYEVKAAREGVRVAEEAIKTTHGILELARAGFDAGLRPPSEKARAEADVAAAEVALIRANVELQMARARVANAVGAAGSLYEPADEALEAPAEVPSETENVKIAVRNRPELRLLDFQREGVSQTLRSVKAEQRPRIDALAGVNSRGHFLTDAATQMDPYSRFNWNVGVVINVPMFQGLLIRKRKEELRAEMKAIDGSQEAIRQAVVLEVQQALALVHAADQAVKASLKGVEAAKLALDTSQGRYEAGLGTLIELVDAQATYVAARSQFVQTTYERHLARAVLSLATGQVGWARAAGD